MTNLKTKKKEIPQSLKGMHDLIGDDYYKYQGFFEKAQEIAVYYGFKPIETPILEKEEVFLSGLGEGTDIIDKEMYSFKAKGSERIAVRPEGTAPTIRAYVEHGLQSAPQPVMLYYYGPYFRHDNPQKGRLRQLRQFGFEIIGTEKSIADALIIHLTILTLKEAGAKNICLDINSIGDKECRGQYQKELLAYYRKNIDQICTTCRQRMKTNPLRLLDCKDPKCAPIKEKAPNSISYLCDPCKKHFKEVLELLEELEIPYQLNKNLVRGLDYYTRTVFEIIESSGEKENPETPGQACSGSGLSLAAGGRYDYLAKNMGNKKDLAAIGAAIGVDRVVKAPWFAKLSPKIMKKPKIYFIQLGAEAKLKSLKIIEMLRGAKTPVYQSLSKDSLGAQLAVAEKLEIPYVIIFGQKEALEQSVIVRNMKNHSQETVKLEKLLDYLKKIK